MAGISEHQRQTAVNPAGFHLYDKPGSPNERLRTFWTNALKTDLPGTMEVPGGEMYDIPKIHPNIKGDAVTILQVDDISMGNG